jgi:hypothetical protein
VLMQFGCMVLQRSCRFERNGNSQSQEEPQRQPFQNVRGSKLGCLNFRESGHRWGFVHEENKIFPKGKIAMLPCGNNTYAWLSQIHSENIHEHHMVKSRSNNVYG